MQISYYMKLNIIKMYLAKKPEQLIINWGVVEAKVKRKTRKNKQIQI